MKYLYSLLFLGFFIVCPSVAQDSQSTREDAVGGVSSRQRFLIENSRNNSSSPVWSRDIYRVVNNSVVANNAFFYPLVSTGDQVNLFSLLLNLISENAIQAYKFDVQGANGTTEPIQIREVLDLYSIPYVTNTDNTISIDRNEIPSDEILSYYVKEKWTFNFNTGKGDARVVAICPVLYRQEDRLAQNVPGLKHPLFWVATDDIAPYLMKIRATGISTDLSLLDNNLSLYDFLRRRHYKGEIYQVGSRVLAQDFTTPEALAEEQARLESALANIESRLKGIR